MDPSRKTQTSSIEWLEAIVARPGLFWGISDNNFHSFVAFVTGLRFGMTCRDDYNSGIAHLVPSDFSRFVADHFGGAAPHAAGLDWSWLIEQNSKDGNDALGSVLRLRRLYDEQAEEEGAANVPPNSDL